MRWFALGATVLSILGCIGSKKDEGTIADGCVDGTDNDGDGSFDCEDTSCAASPDCGGDADTDTDSDSDTDAEPVITFDWDADGLFISIDNLPGSGFELGIAETGATGNGWFGEDCFNGTAGYLYCHGFSGHSGTLGTLSFGGEPGNPDDVIEGVTTLFSEDFAFFGDGSDRLTYMVSFEDDTCMTFGEDPGYYDAFDCTVLQ
jgi:hypothetical protein